MSRWRRARGVGHGEGITLFLHGRADYPFAVMSVARHRADLDGIAHAIGWTAPHQPCIATLVAGSGKPYERNRVAVELGGAMIGYCPLYLATCYLEWLARWRFSRATVCCRAVLLAEAGRAPQVKLDVELPFKATRL